MTRKLIFVIISFLCIQLLASTLFMSPAKSFFKNLSLKDESQLSSETPYLATDPVVIRVFNVGVIYYFYVKVYDLSTDLGCYTVTFDLSYNHTLINITTITVDPLWGVSVVNNNAGVLHVEVNDPSSTPNGEVSIILVQFTALIQGIFPEAYYCQLHFDNITLLGNFGEIPTTGEDGLVMIYGRILAGCIDLYGGAENNGYGSFPNPFPDPFGGRGWHQPMDLVTPRSEVIFYAWVAYNMDPVAYDDVTFLIEGPQGYSSIMYALTNANGVANVTFEMPWSDENPESLMGCWNATATATVGDVTVADSMLFFYSYLVNIADVTTDKSVYNHGEEVTINIIFGTLSMQSYPSLFLITVLDSTNLTIGFVSMLMSTGGSIHFGQMYYVMCSLCFTIPIFAHSGYASISVECFDKNPEMGGLRWCPQFQKSSAFIILAHGLPEQQVIDLVNGTEVYAWDLELETIALSHPDFRSAGSIGANETANLIKEQFESFGLDAWLEPFQFTNWGLLSKPSLVIDEDGNQYTTNDQHVIGSFQCEHYSWPTLEEGIFADLVILPLPSADNYTELGKYPIDTSTWDTIDTTGKIVLIGKEVRSVSNWWSTFSNKIFAETPAAIIYTVWYDWMNFTPPVYASAGGKPLFQCYYWSLGIPSGSVNYWDGLLIRQLEGTQASVSANVTINAVIGEGVHYNVVGRIAGFEHPEKLVIISGHYDTVMCSGFCDNGAGTAGVIELARVFAEAVEKHYYRPKYTLLFVCFTGEEMGLVGSANFVKQHKSEMGNIIAVINLDGIGSDDLYVSDTPGSDLRQTIIDAAADLGIAIYLVSPGGSDQESFRDPSTINDWVLAGWGVDLGISDADPVESSAILVS